MSGEYISWLTSRLRDAGEDVAKAIGVIGVLSSRLFAL